MLNSFDSSLMLWRQKGALSVIHADHCSRRTSRYVKGLISKTQPRGSGATQEKHVYSTGGKSHLQNLVSNNNCPMPRWFYHSCASPRIFSRMFPNDLPTGDPEPTGSCDPVLWAPADAEGPTVHYPSMSLHLWPVQHPALGGVWQRHHIVQQRQTKGIAQNQHWWVGRFSFLTCKKSSMC